MGMMDQDILKVLYTEKQIAARIEAMGMEMYGLCPSPLW